MSIELESIACDLCGRDRYRLLLRARDCRFGRAEEYRVVKCENCGLIYMNPRPTAESILKLYKEDYTPEENLKVLPKIETTRWKTILKNIWHKINGLNIDEILTKANGNVLDVGCGNGYLLLSLKQKSCEVYGVETNPKSAKVCNELGLKVSCGTLEEAKFPDEFFDTIIMSQVIEHLPSPKQTLKEIHRILKPHGKVLIYCPNANSYLLKIFGKYWHGWHIPFHFYNFTEKTMRKFAEETGFTMKRIIAVTPDNFFTVSLKSLFYGEQIGCKRPIKRGKFLNSILFRAAISPVFRILDFALPGRGDCLKAVLTKEQR